MQHLTQVEEKTILGTEYRRAQDAFPPRLAAQKSGGLQISRPRARRLLPRLRLAPVARGGSAAPSAAPQPP